jgi:hypothetical protein
MMDSLNYDDDSMFPRVSALAHTHQPKTLPVYDSQYTGFDASVDIDDLAQILPLYIGKIPTNSCTAVAYTIANFSKAAPVQEDEQHLRFNLKWVVVLGEPE